MSTTRSMSQVESLQNRIDQLTAENEELKKYSEALRVECVALKKELDRYAGTAPIQESENAMLKECIVRMALDRYGVR